jgi:NADPH:quinone reductase-like Zn-dependent oxidoreductase
VKAYRLSSFGLENLSMTDLPTPEPGPTEVLVKIRAVSLNYRDHMVVSGTYNPRMKLPAIPLSDAAGEVVAVGDKVTRWNVGDRVMPLFAQRWISGELTEEKRRSSLGAGPQWDGVLREFAAFDESSVVRCPPDLSFEESATLPCAALTAWSALIVSGNLKPGETVLTLGTGGVSVFALQIAKAAGAVVIATSSSNDKIEKLRSLGADHVINYREREDWDAAVVESLGGKGVDHVVEVGGVGTLQRSLNAVRFGGHIALIGALTGGSGFQPVGVFMKAVRLQGIFTGSAESLRQLCRAIEIASIKPVIDKTFEFSEARSAFEHLASGAHFGKIVIRMP